MADILKLITLTEKNDSGPNYDAFYSTDCINFTQSVDGSNINLPTVGSTAVITVPEETQCVKLQSIPEPCSNFVISGSVITTTTTSTSTSTSTTTSTTSTSTTSTTTSTTIPIVETYWSGSGCEDPFPITTLIVATQTYSPGDVVKLENGACYTLISTHEQEPFIKFFIASTYTNCNDCLGITTTTTTSPQTFSYDIHATPTNGSGGPAGGCDQPLPYTFYSLRNSFYSIVVGDILYSDAGATTPWNGGNLYYGVGDGLDVVSGQSWQIASDGEFLGAVLCVTTSTTTEPITTTTTSTTTVDPYNYYYMEGCPGTQFDGLDRVVRTTSVLTTSLTPNSADATSIFGSCFFAKSTTTKAIYDACDPSDLSCLDISGYTIVSGCDTCIGTTTSTTIPVTTTTTTVPGCYTYSIQNNDLSQNLTFGYTDCDGNPVTDVVVLADSSTPDFCAEQGSVYRQSGTNSWVLTIEATSCTVVPTTTSTTQPITTTSTTIPVTTTSTTVVECNCITVDVLNTQLTDGGLDLYYIVNDCGGGSRDINLAQTIGTEQDGSTYFGICSRGTTSDLFKYGPSGSPFVGIEGMNINPNGTICTVDGDCLPVVPVTTTTTIPVTTTTTIPVTTTSTTIPVTTTTTTVPGCYTYSIQNNSLTENLTFQYRDCEGTLIQDVVVLADSGTPDFCAEQGSVARQSGTFSWVLTTEATTCTVTTTTQPPVTTTTTVAPSCTSFDSGDPTVLGNVCNTFAFNTYYHDGPGAIPEVGYTVYDTAGCNLGNEVGPGYYRENVTGGYYQTDVNGIVISVGPCV